jgi:hypothetical protein
LKLPHREDILSLSITSSSLTVILKTQREREREREREKGGKEGKVTVKWGVRLLTRALYLFLSLL